MSAKGLLGMTIVLLPNALPFIGFPLNLKLDLAFLKIPCKNFIFLAKIL